MNSCLAVALSVLLVTGCSAIKHNVALSEPTDGAKARVRIAMPKYGNGRNVVAYPNSACAGNNVPGKGRVLSNYVIGFEETLNNKKIGMAKTAISMNESFIKSEVYVPAGGPLTLRTFKVRSESVSAPTSIAGTSLSYVTTTRHGDGCGSVFTFVADEGGDYEVVVGGDMVSCSVSVSKIIENGIESYLEPVQFVQSATCLKKERLY